MTDEIRPESSPNTRWYTSRTGLGAAAALLAVVVLVLFLIGAF